jgi:hypothetical protein
MQRLSKWLIGELPDFARRDTPFMRQILNQQRNPSPRTRLWRILRLVLIALVLLIAPFVGWYLMLYLGVDPMSAPTVLDRVFVALFWLLVVFQTGVRIVALTSGAGVVSSAMRAESWDTVKATPDGAAFAVKTYWASVMYRIAPALILMIIWRLYFTIVLIYNLTSYEGQVFSVFLGGTVPLGTPQFIGPDNHLTSTAVIIAIVLMAMTLTACLLITVTGAALDAAFGIWLGTIARGRVVNTFGQAFLILVRVAVTVFALWIGNAAMSAGGTSLITASGDATPFSPPVAWIATVFGLVEGDMGLSLLHLWNYPQLWANVDYSVLIGLAFLILVLLQAGVADRLIYWSAQRASRADRA